MQRNPVLEVRALAKAFKRPVAQELFKEVDLTVYAGETVAIAGRSGAGKSTLLQLLGLLDTPTAGEVSIMGAAATRWNRAALRRTHIGFVFQTFCLLGEESALENVLMGARIARQPVGAGSAAQRRASHLLDSVGLAHRHHHSGKLLSGGEKQRVAIARALYPSPSLILADEPTGNLDGETAHEIHQLLLDSVDATRALVVVTHDPTLLALCQRRYVLQEGKLLPLFNL